MARRFDMDEMIAMLAKYNERKTETEKALSKIKSYRKQLAAKIANEERKIRNQQLLRFGEIQCLMQGG